MFWKKSWILIGVLFATLAAHGFAQIVTTQVADTIYRADGSPATGTALISWPAFTTVNGDSVPAGSTSATIAANGALSVQLIANAGATPLGSYYTVVYHLDNGSVTRQYWVVPASGVPVKISAIASTVLPTSVAMQTVSKAYVDTAIAAATSGHPLDSTPYVLKSGDAMTGPLSLPADPVSSTQAADKHYVDSSVAAVAGGLTQKVSTLPSGSQTVTQPAGTQLSANRLNGVEYASQYVTGGGNNGIANAATGTDCADGCNIHAEQTYTSEATAPSTWANQTHLQDLRGGRQVDTYLNPLDVVTHQLATAQAITDVSTQSEADIAQQTGTSIPGSIGLAVTQQGLAGGSNIFPEHIEDGNIPYFKMGYSALSVNGIYNTQGQHVLEPMETHCYGVGDCLIGSQILYASGGVRDNADEGAHPFDLQFHEDPAVFTGICSNGCTAGSTSLTVTPTGGAGTQGDGRFLIDTNPAKTITSASTGGWLVGGAAGNPHASAQFLGTGFPVSTFLSTAQVLTSQNGVMAPGTVTVPIASSGVPSGYVTTTGTLPGSGIACVADQTNGYVANDYEMAPYTVLDATHLQMTLNKPHAALATIAVGGLCGYGVEQTADTAAGIRQVFPVVGSYSATGLYYAAASSAILGVTGSTSAYFNVSAPISSIVRAGNMVTVATTDNITAMNGLTASVSGAADASFDGSFAITTTGPNSFTYAQSGADASSTGGAVTVLTGGFALYPMAEVLSVFNPASKAVDGQMTLAPNNVLWAANDPVEQPHFYQQFLSADTEFIGQTMPRPSIQFRAGIAYQQNNTAGMIGWSIQNAAPVTNYMGFGGTHSVPDAAYEASGVWRRVMNVSAGEQAVFGVHCNLHGCGAWNSGYNLFELDSTVGADLVGYAPQTSTLSFTMRGGTPYSFSPQAFTASTIDAVTVNATTLNGALDAGNIASGTVAASRLPAMGASGVAHAAGIVPDPGTIAGTARYLREDGTWAAPGGSTGIASGALADYAFTEGAGTTLTDHSGNGNDATLGSGSSAPTWTASGLAFNGGTDSSASYVQLPATLDSARTMLFAMYINPLDQTAQNAFASSLVTSSLYPDGTNISLVANINPIIGGSFGVGTYRFGFQSGCGQMISGFHVLAVYLGSSFADPDRLWIDGAECPSYSNRSYVGGFQPSGNLYLGHAPQSSSGFGGTLYRALLYPGALTPVQVQQTTAALLGNALQRSIPTTATNVAETTPQLHAIGDSITVGYGADYSWVTKLSLERQPTYAVNNWGVTGALLTAIAGSEPNRVGTRCITQSGPSLAVVFAGTNDFGTAHFAVQTVMGSLASEVQTLKHAGCTVFVGTMLSRGGQDADKDAFDEQLLAQAKPMGADGVIDFAAEPNLGADGAYADASWFNGDQVHPTDAGQTRLGQIASNALNYYFGYKLAQPHVVTSSVYTLDAADAAVTAAPTANAAYTMPDCTGASGAVYSIMNPQSTYTLTVQGGPSQPINGLATPIAIAPNSKVELHDVPNPKSASGCHWVM